MNKKLFKYHENNFFEINATFIEVKKKLQFIEIYISEYKKLTKLGIGNIWRKIITLQIFFTLFPFIVGLSQIIWLRYQNQSFWFFFNKNLPGFFGTDENISCDTFHQILHKDFQENFYRQIKQIDFYNDFIFIKKNDLENLKEKQYYIGNFENKKFCTNFNFYKISSTNYNIPARYFANNLKFFYYNLDELPLKINSIFYSSNKNGNEVEFLPLPNFFFLKKNSSLQKISYNKKSNLPVSFLSNSSKKDNKYIFFGFKKNELSSEVEKYLPENNFFSAVPLEHLSEKLSQLLYSEKTNLSESSFFSYLKNNREKFRKKYKIFDNEIKKFFYYDDLVIIPFFQTNKLQVLKTSIPNIKNNLLYNFNFSDYCSKDLLKLLSEATFNNFKFEKNNQSTSIIWSSISNRSGAFLNCSPQIIFKPRIMSGYFYPDLNSKQVKSFLLTRLYLNHIKFNNLKNFNKSNFNNSQLKINLSTNFIFPSKTSFFLNKLKVPNLKIQYQPTFLEGVQYRQILFQGPGVVLDENTKDLVLNNTTEIQQWLKNSLYSDNSLSDRKETFFGQNKNFLLSSKHNSENVVTLEKNLNKVDLDVSKNEDKKYFLIDSFLSLEKEKFYDFEPVIPCITKFRVPYLQEQHWRSILEKIKAESTRFNLVETPKNSSSNETTIKNLETDLQISIPLIRIRYPKQKPIIWPLTFINYSNNLFHQNSFVNSFINLENSLINKQFKLNYNYLPYSQNLLSQYSLNTKNFGSIYKKFFSSYSSEKDFTGNKNSLQIEKRITSELFFTNKLFKNLFKNFQTSFYESWEPITHNSWMIVAQYGFGLFVLQILQNFYKKYGKELVSYLVDIVASLGILDEGLKEELDLDDHDKGFRIIKKIEKRFRNIAGIHLILPELSEIVWFLRNSGRSFKLGKIVPKGILLIGPPGTGKTLLVQAIAGEAEVPVLVQSGSSLNDLEKTGLGVYTLKNLFSEARRLAPCIIFIDEIDTLGEKRENVIKNPMGADEIVESIYDFDIRNLQENPSLNEESSFFPQLNIKNLKIGSGASDENLTNFYQPFDLEQNSTDFAKQSDLNLLQEAMTKHETKQQQLTLLMQFLVELDGLQLRKGVLVIGATNRPNVLDFALTRPGRFDQIINLELPAKQKRIEILKLYAKNLGTKGINDSFKSTNFNSVSTDLRELSSIQTLLPSISWDYFANRTVGFSAADLAAVMNESAIQAILKETIHTVETIEKGIDLITTYSFEESNLNYSADPFFITRLAFYQAGKAILYTILPNHPPAVVLHLSQRPKNARHSRINSIFQNNLLKQNSRLELETRLIGLYSGKAAELLILCNEFNPQDQFWSSNFGIEDLNYATVLAYFMIDKWYFYSKKIAIKKSNQLHISRNLQEIEDLDLLELFKQLTQEIEKQTSHEIEFFDSQRIYQEWSFRPWWQVELTKDSSLLDGFYGDWYRLYLPDPEESERNEEWVPPDIYYHNNNSFKDINIQSQKTLINWNNLYKIDRDYLYHSLILLSFNKAFLLLDETREILDFIADFLIRFEIIRQDDILSFITKFIKLPKKFVNKNLQNSSFNYLASKESKNFENKKYITEKFWGQNSRRTITHFIKFD